jgi:SAM-dependent methyltransferase
MKMLARAFMPVKFRKIYREYRGREFNYLDVGCGNHSPSRTRKWFPGCSYYGIDLDEHKNDEEDFSQIVQFFKIDLRRETEKLAGVPDNFFDVIMMSHIVEHLDNGLDVIGILLNKLKEGGKIYIEFPSERSLSLPHMHGTLNFCDDPTHIRIYGIAEVANLLMAGNLRIIRAGRRRDPVRMLATPFGLLYHFLRRGKLVGGALWDIAGFADYVYAEKPPVAPSSNTSS